jgi:hypothetical protein
MNIRIDFLVLFTILSSEPKTLIGPTNARRTRKHSSEPKLVTPTSDYSPDSSTPP